MNAPAEAKATLPPGEVITFYSYKGGTGRSMLLANVAWLLASSGRKVLVVDWDLEAPGLHRYFRPFLGDDPELRCQEGVIEWMNDYWDACLDENDADVPTLVRDYADPRHYVRRLETDSFIVGGAIDLLCAGQQDSSYAASVADFDWTRLYRKLRGAQFIEASKQILVGHGGYDYVLVDARTGVSDTSGFCTVGLADTLVVCFSYNNQSVIGASQIARDIRRQAEILRAGQVRNGTARRFRLFAVPSRVDELDPERLESRQRHSWASFADLLTDVAPSQQTAYWVSVQIRNQALFAYEEVLATCVSHPNDRQSVLGSVAELTRWLTDDAFTEVPALSDQQRRELRKRFAEFSEQQSRPTSVTAWDLFTERMPDPQARESLLQECFPLLVQLFTVTEGTAADASTPNIVRALLHEADFTKNECRMADILTSFCITQRRIMEGRQRGLLIRDDSIMRQWDSLRTRLQEHSEVLGLRHRLQRARQSWESGGRSLAVLSSLQSELGNDIVAAEPRAWLGRPNLEMLETLEELRNSQRTEQELRNNVQEIGGKYRNAQRRERTRSVLLLLCLVVIGGLIIGSALFYQQHKIATLTARAQVADAWQLYQKHKYPDAQRAFDSLVRSLPSDPRPLVGRALTRGQLRQYGPAADDMHNAIKMIQGNAEPLDPQYFYWLGSYYQNAGDGTRAVDAYNDYIAAANSDTASGVDASFLSAALSAIATIQGPAKQ